jgi:hypothetical protein
MIDISLISTLDKFSTTEFPFVALTQLRYRVDAGEERLRETALSEYPRSVQVIAPDASRHAFAAKNAIEPTVKLIDSRRTNRAAAKRRPKSSSVRRRTPAQV